MDRVLRQLRIILRLPSRFNCRFVARNLAALAYSVMRSGSKIARVLLMLFRSSPKPTATRTATRMRDQSILIIILDRTRIRISILLNHASARLHPISTTLLLYSILLIPLIMDRAILLGEVLGMALDGLGSLMNQRLVLTANDLALLETLLHLLLILLRPL